MLRFLINDPNKDLENLDFSSYIITYLINGGMKQEEVNDLISLLTK